MVDNNSSKKKWKDITATSITSVKNKNKYGDKSDHEIVMRLRFDTYI